MEALGRKAGVTASRTLQLKHIIQMQIRDVKNLFKESLINGSEAVELH